MVLPVRQIIKHNRFFRNDIVRRERLYFDIGHYYFHWYVRALGMTIIVSGKKHYPSRRVTNATD